tara:strand:+ start:94 stop:726 length:633 start_codon:yes stop_codon:yes gene_type:complete
MGEEKLNIINPFGPSIAKVKIPDKIIKSLNDHVDKIRNNEKLSEKFDAGKTLIGNVKQEIFLSKEIIEESGWLSFLANSTRAWIKFCLGKNITKFNINSSWVVSQFSNEYNPVHWHNGHISGAGFLKLPPTFGKTFQKEKKNLNGRLVLIHGSKSFMSDSKYEIIPEVGDFYIFPHYLMHAVYPFKDTNEERRSISFNAVVDEKSFDVFI